MIPRQPDHPQPDPPKIPRSGLVPSPRPTPGRVCSALRAHVRARIAQEQARIPIWTWLTRRTVPAWTAVVAVGLLLVVGMQLWRGLQQGQPSCRAPTRPHLRPWTSSVWPDACTPIGSRPGSHMPPRSALWLPPVLSERSPLPRSALRHRPPARHTFAWASSLRKPWRHSTGTRSRPPHCGWRSCSRP